MRRVLTEAGWTSCAEERANAITHGITAGLAIASLVALIIIASNSGDPRRIITASIFGASLVLLYLASTIYHAWPLLRESKHNWRVLDHAAIYIAIAGSYTPFLLVFLRGALAWSLLGALWLLATYGVVSKLRAFDQSPWRSLALYLGMGWIGIVAAKPFLDAMPGGCVAWIVAGGLTYTVGVIFYRWERLPFHHAVWHLFVTAGSACHVVAVMRYVVPVPA